jgi:hypothetical protein
LAKRPANQSDWQAKNVDLAAEAGILAPEVAPAGWRIDISTSAIVSRKP